MSPRHYLLKFDRRSGDLDTTDFGGDADAAMDAYEAAESEHRSDDEIEVVLIGAESLDTIRITHPHYFNKERGTDSLTQLEEQVRKDREAL